ncbi:MAG: hypothetical protein EOP06_20455 [Proteobacteria bacterium]|nr:MAG: hypothetical protein EOP06_20455 [Pseudomonadota bacterium]
MKLVSSPAFWLIFGFFGYPVVCFLGGLVGIDALHYLGLMRASGVPEFGWGGIIFIVFGIPLGAVSAICAFLWRKNLVDIARLVAFLSGALMLLIWARLSLPFLYLEAMIGECGFYFTPVIWALGLLGFAFLARTPKGDPG